MNLKEYLTCDDKEELTNRLKNLDNSLMQLHQSGLYVVSFDANNIKLYDDELIPASFNNKVDYIDSGINPNGQKKDILEMCAIGICAYNGFSSFYTNNEFLTFLIEKLPIFAENKKIPPLMYEYYKDVLLNGNIDYLNNYIEKNDSNINSNKSSTRNYTKSTAIGKAYTEKGNGYVNVLLLPTIVAIIYNLVIALLMIFK